MERLTDYGGYFKSANNYNVFEIETLGGIQDKIKKAYTDNTKVRVRGMGHSMNGNSLPKENEYLIITASCNHFKFEKEGCITVGSGAAIWDVNQMLNSYGYELLVYNDGGAPASTVGGYLSAGGIGEHCYLYGGFWETVDKVTLINGKGGKIESSYGDSIFPWLFGSMGQLGFIYEVELKIKPLKETIVYPKGKIGKVTASNFVWPKQAWYNIFTTKQYADEAKKELVLLSKIHRHVWAARPIYYYDFTFKRFNPPLIHPEQTDLVAVGVWGDAWEDKGFNMFAMQLLEKDFAALIHSNTHFRRYVQTEIVFEDFDYELYFGEKVYTEFKKIKNQLDPKGIFGEGIFNV